MEFNVQSDSLLVNGNRVVTKTPENFLKTTGLTDGVGTQITPDEFPLIDGVYIKDKYGNKLNTGRNLNIWYEMDTTSRSFSTTWADGRTWTNRIKTPGSKILFSWHCIYRNSSVTTNWGGGYTDILYSIDNGSNWVSLGTSGYDGDVMLYLAGGIGSMSGTFLVNLDAVTNASQIRFKFRHRSYSDTLLVNQDWNAASHMFTNTTIQEIGQ